MTDLTDEQLEQLEFMLDNAGIMAVLKAIEMYCMSMALRDQEMNRIAWDRRAANMRSARWEEMP